MKRWMAALPLVALLALGAVFAGYGLRHDPHYTPNVMVGHALPDVTLAQLNGGPPVALRSVAAPGTLVNFYASWCVPCVQEAPTLMALKAEGVPIVGIAVGWNYDADKTRALLAQHGDPYAVTLVDQNGQAGLDFGISGVPETYLVGPGGIIAAKTAAPLTPDSAEQLLEQGGNRR